MALSAGGQPLTRLNQMSPKARLVLGFVAGGADWFEWAVSQPEDVYTFPDEAALVETIQSGIHGNGMTLLRQLGLEVHVQRLWQLSPEVLGVLEAAEDKGEGGGPPDLKTRRTLAANNLLPHTELATGTEFLARLGVEEDPVFQAMNLFDETVVFNLVNLATETAVDNEAATFALAQAVSPVEFVDYFELYLTVADSIEGRSTAKIRRARAREAVELLDPYLTAMLRCPHAPRPLPPTEAIGLARAWLETGRPMGFSRLSQGLNEIVGFTGGGVADKAAATRAVEAYTRTLNHLLRNHQPVSEELSQDGSRQQFRVEGKEGHAVLVRNRLMETLTVETLKKQRLEE